MTNSDPAETDPETLRRMPYQKPQPAEILPDLVVNNAIPDDENALDFVLSWTWTSRPITGSHSSSIAARSRVTRSR